MTSVKDILSKKGARVVFIGPDLTLREALDTMIDKYALVYDRLLQEASEHNQTAGSSEDRRWP